MAPLGSIRSHNTYVHKVCRGVTYGHRVCVPFTVVLSCPIAVQCVAVSVAEASEHPLPISDEHERDDPRVLAGAARDEHGVDVPVVDIDVVERGPAHS